MSRHLCFALAILSASSLLAACETDDSLPTRPRTSNFLTPDSNAQENAEHKALEGPTHELPGAGSEYPGKSAAVPASTGPVLTLDAATTNTPGATVSTPTNPNFPISGFTGPSSWDAFGHTHGPTTEYNRDAYPGPIPHIPSNPGTTPMTGSTTLGNSDWPVDFSWGQGLTLQDYPHRPWPKTTALYQDGTVTHNPLYYFNLEDHSAIPTATGPRTNDIQSTLIEIPWFFANTLALPVLMALEPPLAVRTTTRAGADPSYHGSVPTAGPVVPVPMPGTLRWDYPFMNPDGTIKPSKDLPKSQPVEPEKP